MFGDPVWVKHEGRKFEIRRERDEWRERERERERERRGETRRDGTNENSNDHIMTSRDEHLSCIESSWS